jgi:hypothetical protein
MLNGVLPSMGLSHRINLLTFLPLSKTVRGIMRFKVRLTVAKVLSMLKGSTMLQTGLKAMAPSTQEIGPMAIKQQTILETGLMQMEPTTLETMLIMQKADKTSIRSKELKLTSKAVKKVRDKARAVAMREEKMVKMLKKAKTEGARATSKAREIMKILRIQRILHLIVVKECTSKTSRDRVNPHQVIQETTTTTDAIKMMMIKKIRTVIADKALVETEI